MEFSTDHLTFEVPDMNPKARLRELIIHIANASQTDSRFGKTKLVKLLYFSDFTSFRESGKPITGHRYVKMQNGPYPDDLDALLREMKASGEIVIWEDITYGHLHPQLRIIPLRQANLEPFSAQNIAIVDEIIRQYWNYSGSDVASLTHGLAWVTAGTVEAIPYEASILSDEELTQADIDHIDALVQQYGVNPE